jgi:ubiquinone/menaquinone biosynthesis C-methylase UbiE
LGLANWYDETILPKIIGLGCGTPEVTALRAQVVPLARGAVFELGCGGGYNQPLYDRAAVTSFAGIDPNGALLEAARGRAQANGWAAEIRQGVGEAIPFDDASFDTVVCTYTLCSVHKPKQVLSEMRRILKPGGTMLYLEHGKAPDAAPQKWQRRIEPVWKKLMGNCHLTREVGAAIAPTGFEIEPVGQEYFAGMPKWSGWMEWGVARKIGV